MKALTFRLSGSSAFFKKPDVNTYLYFTYSNIHKVALLGMLGAIIGLKGYGSEEEGVPVFFNALKDLKIAIVPRTANEEMPGLCSKKIQVFNNSVGYASKEAGGNLIVKEQWLEKPSWDIYILEDEHPYYTQLKDYMLNKKCVYIPYLGKNDHFASISEEQEVAVEQVVNNIGVVHSLCLKKDVRVKEESFSWLEESIPYYKYEENLPIKLEPINHQYEVETFIFTNRTLEVINKEKLYQQNNQVLYFF